MGLTLEGASKEEIAELDRLLSVMADMRAPLKQGVKEGEREEEGEREKEGVRERREVRDSVKEGREEEKPTWGTTIAGVSTKHLHAFCTLKCLVMSIIMNK